MASAALLDWQTKRAKRLDELMDAHRAMSGSGRGRRWRTQQVNWAIILRLAGEFQGFARDLHDLTVDEFAAQMGSSPATASVVRTMASSNRGLDRGNAHPKCLAQDFGVFAMQVWPAIEGQWPRATRWKADLDLLNQARNGIAHDDQRKIQVVETAGYPLSRLQTFKRFRSSLDSLARCLDEAVADHCATIFQSPRPW